MTFLSPLFLLGLISLPIPFIIHLWHRHRMRKLEFPSIALLRRAEHGEKALKRLKELLLLILRTLALLFLVLGFANPGVLRKQKVAILDNSYDMMAKSNSQTIFESGEKVANQLKVKGYKILLASGDVYPGECKYQRFSIPTEGVNYVITKSGKMPQIPGIELKELTGGEDNFAIDSLFLTSSSLRAVVTNHTDAPGTRIVSFTSANQNLETRINTPPYATAVATFPITSPAEAVTLKIDDDDLAVDNTRYFVDLLPPPLKVLIVGTPDEAFFLKSALSPERGRSNIKVKVSSKLESPTNYDVIVFLSSEVKYTGEGTLVCSEKAAELKGFVTLNWLATTHPIFRGFKFIPELKKIKFTAREEVPIIGKVIAKFSDGTPAIMEIRPRNIQICFPLSLGSGELVLSPLFVPLMHRIMYWLANKPLEAHNFVVGETVRFKVSESKPYECISPAGTQKLLPRAESHGIYVYMTPEIPGIYEILELTEFAVNIDKALVQIPLSIEQTRVQVPIKKFFFIFVLVLLVAELIIRRL